ncbi:hypothetical protein BH09BAC5_BH09BAC5_07640 [soil metagenome]
MSAIFSRNVSLLKSIVNRFDPESKKKKEIFLNLISKNKLVYSKTLESYFETLLFICAFPSDKQFLIKAEKELERVSHFLKIKSKSKTDIFANSGLPWTKFISCFTHDFVIWLNNHPDIRILFNKFEDETFELNDVLKLTLPSLERSVTTSGLTNEELLDSLQVKENNRLKFILSELNKLNAIPYIKDHLYDGLRIYAEITPKNKNFSRAYNRISNAKIFFHDEILKKFDHMELLNRKVNDALALTAFEKTKLIEVVKNAMALTYRETDTVTYMDENSIRLYELERGISIAIYGMIPQRQMPLESYVGYTLFKNGLPAVYGGGWVFGERSDFGINIFESFRGGESAYMMCQLLRLYRQVFNVNYFQVEPYQYGLDNPEGISSGAFWFYYRNGFRPLDKNLLKVADNEFKKIVTSKKYRTSKKTLVSFTKSNIALQMERNIPVSVYDITAKVSKLIQKDFKGDRSIAEKKCVEKFMQLTGLNFQLNENEKEVLKEVALWSEVLKIKEEDKLKLLLEMVKVKPVNLYRYQKLLLQFFEK